VAAPLSVPKPKVLELIGFTGMVQPLPQERDNRYRFLDPIFSKCPLSRVQWLLSKTGEFYRVIGTAPTINNSFDKMDVAPVYDFRAHPMWQQTMRYMFTKMKPLFCRTRVWSSEEIVVSMTLKASAGVWSLYKIKTKGEYFMTDGCVSYIFSDEFWTEEQIWKVVPKTEWYPASKLDEGKVRTFIVPPPELVYWGKMFFGEQNELLKNFWWSAYGFNPYSGGVHRLASNLLRHSLFVFYDVVGWDRKLPTLSEVYELRNSFISEQYLLMARRLAEKFVNSVLLHPNGCLYRKKHGNNSGAPNTTSDNILSHMMMLVLILLVLFDGDEEYVDDCIAALFGDDDVLAIPDVGHSDEHIQFVFTSVFSLFGLTMDPFVITRDLSDCEFLGFKFKRCDLYPAYWIPCYPTDRLLASFCYDFEKMDLASSICKAWSLTVMAAGGEREIFDGMCEILSDYCLRYSTSEDPVVRSYIDTGPPTYESCIHFYLGFEHSLPQQVVGGINDLVNEFSKCKETSATQFSKCSETNSSSKNWSKYQPSAGIGGWIRKDLSE